MKNKRIGNMKTWIVPFLVCSITLSIMHSVQGDHSILRRTKKVGGWTNTNQLDSRVINAASFAVNLISLGEGPDETYKFSGSLIKYSELQNSETEKKVGELKIQVVKVKQQVSSRMT